MAFSSIHYGNRGVLGQTVNFNPDNNNNGLWLEGSDADNGESAGIFMNGNTLVMWSPGDNFILRVYDEDSLPTGTPLFAIGNNGEIFQRNVVIHPDYVFDEDFPLE